MVAMTGGDHQLEERICEAAVRCIARTGLRRTTLDDVALEAGCSRASIYRVFPGGKDRLWVAALEREVAALEQRVATALADADGLAETLTAAIVETARALAGHDALRHLLEHEPGVVLPHLSFDGLGPVLERAVAFLVPWLECHLDPRSAAEAAEWVARLIVLYGADAHAPYDLTDPGDVRRLVATHLIPGLVPRHEVARHEQEHVNVLD